MMTVFTRCSTDRTTVHYYPAEVFGPDVTDRETLLSRTRMSNDAYTTGPWYNVDGFNTASHFFSLSCLSKMFRLSVQTLLYSESAMSCVHFPSFTRVLGSAQQVTRSHGIYT